VSFIGRRRKGCNRRFSAALDAISAAGTESDGGDEQRDRVFMDVGGFEVVVA
jgi:hypothetical protein